MNVVNLDVDRLLQNDEMSCRIHLPYGNKDSLVIRGYLTSNFGFNIGNKWGQIADINSVPVLGDLLNNANLLFTLLDQNSGGSVPQISPQPIPATAASWQGSDMPIFTVSLAFISTDYTINPLESLLSLAEGALPQSENNLTQSSNKYIQGATSGLNNLTNGAIDFIGDLGNNILSTFGASENLKNGYNDAREKAKTLNNQMYKVGTTAPFGFGLNLSTKGSNGEDGEVMAAIPNTTITLAIGNWFFATNLIMESISNINISKEIIRVVNGRGGWPLFVECSVTLRPYKMITYPDFLKYFKLRTA